MNKLYTIGYAKHSLESFVATIRKHEINAIADVRSVPFSSFAPTFNRNSLSNYLKLNNIQYVFLGNECGAKIDDPSCYNDGKVDYKLVAKHKKFQSGLSLIIKGSEEKTIALMCAEKDPINCHRMILICRSLKKFGLAMHHVLDADIVESQSESEHRLLKLFKLNQLELFHSKNDQLERAYDKQGERIAYKEDSDSGESNSEGDFIDAKY